MARALVRAASRLISTLLLKSQSCCRIDAGSANRRYRSSQYSRRDQHESDDSKVSPFHGLTLNSNPAIACANPADATNPKISPVVATLANEPGARLPAVKDRNGSVLRFGPGRETQTHRPFRVRSFRAGRGNANAGTGTCQVSPGRAFNTVPIASTSRVQLRSSCCNCARPRLVSV